MTLEPKPPRLLRPTPPRRPAEAQSTPAKPQKGSVSPPRPPAPHQDSDSTPDPQSESADHTQPADPAKHTDHTDQLPESDSTETSQEDATRLHPIPPPGDAMQYRAIGLIEGQYLPSAEQFTRGVLKTSDGTILDAVLLGRMINLTRKYLKTDQDYLWVVYPRTREQEQHLHVQIMGVWAPEEMGQSLPPQSNLQIIPNIFSIRGEVVFQSQDQGFIIVKIRQVNKKDPKGKPQSFKLRLEGTLEGKGVGTFWDLQVQRRGSALQIETATPIAAIPKSPPRPRKPQRKPRPKDGEAPVGNFSKPQRRKPNERSGPDGAFERSDRSDRPVVRERPQLRPKSPEKKRKE